MKYKVKQTIWSLEHQQYFYPVTPILNEDGERIGEKQTVVDLTTLNPDMERYLIEQGVLEPAPEPSKPVKKESADG